jgi:hypothetical protein
VLVHQKKEKLDLWLAILPFALINCLKSKLNRKIQREGYILGKAACKKEDRDMMAVERGMFFLSNGKTRSLCVHQHDQNLTASFIIRESFQQTLQLHFVDNVGSEDSFTTPKKKLKNFKNALITGHNRLWLDKH